MSRSTAPANKAASPIAPLSLYKRLSLAGTWVTTLFGGRLVGTDGFGNRYYEGRAAKSPTSTNGHRRRWVIYKGMPEASTVPPEWHGWLHYTNESPIAETSPFRKDWQQPYEPNLTGSAAAYHPPGAQSEGGQRAAATGDYESWKPN